MRVLVSGGGTGGHINPALAIADRIKADYPGSVIEYVGTQKGLETKLVPAAGYKIHYVKVRGIKRKLTLSNVSALIEAVTSVIEAKRIIKNFKPDIVIGTGGYVCWPVLKAASSMGIPTLVHESNALPGVATKMLASHVDKILLNFRESENLIKAPAEKLIHVGNPVKSEMFTLTKEHCRKKLGIPFDKKVLLSYGGSLGARVLNNTVFEMISEKKISSDICHIHATGNGYWEAAKEHFLPMGYTETDENTIEKENVQIKRYIYNMPELMACADVVICRAGAMTVSEISAMGKAAIFIPSPNVTDNHQYKNALVLKKAGAAELLEEKDLTSGTLADAVNGLFANTEKAEEYSQKVKHFAEPGCLDKIISVVDSLVKK